MSIRIPASQYQDVHLAARATLGEIKLWQVSLGLYAHKFYLVLGPDTTATNTYRVVADVIFKLRGAVTARLPAVFSNDSTLGLRVCLFPNTTNATSISRDALMLDGFSTQQLYVFPRVVIAGCDEVSLDLKQFISHTVGGTTPVATAWKGFAAIESANTPF